MEKFFNSKKVSTILSILTVIFAIISLVMFFIQGMGFEEPIIWVMILLLIFSIGDLLFSIKK